MNERADPAVPLDPEDPVGSHAFRSFLAEFFGCAANDVQLARFPAGHSNLTYRLELPSGSFVLRRPPAGYESIAAGHDMEREYRILAGLARTSVPAPQPVAFFEPTGSPLAMPCFVMRRIEGRILRASSHAERRLPPSDVRSVCGALARTFAEIHAVDWSACGLASIGRPEGYVGRQVEGWQRRYERAHTDEIASMSRVGAWLSEHVPATSGAALLHNDFKLDNVVLDPDDVESIRGVLDWEMATLGDPLADLGTTLAYWEDPTDPDDLQRLGFAQPPAPGYLTRREFVAAYAAASGRAIEHVEFYYVLGLYKVAVIAQQLYTRSVRGLTSDPRFRGLLPVVRLLADRAESVIATGSV